MGHAGILRARRPRQSIPPSFTVAMEDDHDHRTIPLPGAIAIVENLDMVVEGPTEVGLGYCFTYEIGRRARLLARGNEGNHAIALNFRDDPGFLFLDAVSVVPEPMTQASLGAGLAGLYFGRRPIVQDGRRGKHLVIIQPRPWSPFGFQSFRNASFHSANGRAVENLDRIGNGLAEAFDQICVSHCFSYEIGW